jgi:hypothetical protein
MKKLIIFMFSIVLLGSCLNDKNEVFRGNIGDTYQGGIVFYLDSNGGGLIAAPTDQSNGAEWGRYGTVIQGADGTAIGTGNQNTIDIEAGDTISGTAADICANLTLGGYSDWFLPSKDELNEMYLNKSIIGGFSDYNYWSSSEYVSEDDDPMAWSQTFSNWFKNRSQGKNGKDAKAYVRAIRAF